MNDPVYVCCVVLLILGVLSCTYGETTAEPSESVESMVESVLDERLEQLMTSAARENDDELMEQVDRLIMARITERKLDSWRPGPENADVPSEEIRIRNVDISGQWAVNGPMDGSSLSICESTPDRYQVTFSTWGCLFRYSLARTGQYVDGVLTLDRPVDEYCPRTYRKLYSVRIDDQVCLVPSAVVRRLEAGLSQGGMEQTIAVHLYAYRGNGSRGPLLDQDETATTMPADQKSARLAIDVIAAILAAAFRLLFFGQVAANCSLRYRSLGIAARGRSGD